VAEQISQTEPLPATREYCPVYCYLDCYGCALENCGCSVSVDVRMMRMDYYCPLQCGIEYHILGLDCESVLVECLRPGGLNIHTYERSEQERIPV
jgi:hypothetical protein